MNYDDMIWSYSRVNTYIGCPRAFYFNYLADGDVEKEENAFAQFGSFMHELIERMCKGELDTFRAVAEYKSKFDKVITCKFPYNKYVNLKTKYYGEGLKYLTFFSGYKGYEIVDIEKELLFEVDGYKFKGFIDLVLRDKDGKLIILDHKSKAEIEDSEKEEYFRQLYLYSVPCEELYGTQPDRLVLSLFRKRNVVVVNFDKKASKKALKTLINTIETIKTDKEFLPKHSTIKDINNDFFCSHICSHKKSCKGVIKNKCQIKL